MMDGNEYFNLPNDNQQYKYEKWWNFVNLKFLFADIHW